MPWPHPRWDTQLFSYLYLAVLGLRRCTGLALAAVSGDYSSHSARALTAEFPCCGARAQ